MLETPSWTTEFGRAFKTSSELANFLGWELPSSVEKTYPVFVPLRLALRMKDEGPGGPLSRQFLPHADELLASGLLDPIGDREHFSAPQLIHRYPTRVLFTPTSICPVNCRYCFRKNELSPKDELFQGNFAQTVAYLKENPQISELIFTGGDPLTLSNEKIRKYLEEFATLPTLKDIRFHTRYPVILPQRFDEDFINILNEFCTRFRTLSLVIHVNHASELDDLSRRTLRSLQRTPVQLLSQSVLLRGVNDSVSVLKDLIEVLIDLKIRPYYLHHPDQVKGGSHFYLPLSEGREIYSSLRPQIPGWALPQYVVDIPGGHGKVNAFNPESFAFSGKMIGQDGSLHAYDEPE